jgi:GNAT superfamily N-acetyltransferase
MRITPATPADIPALAGLLSQLFTQEVEFSPDPEAQRRGLARIIADPAIGIILVAKEDDAVLGMANLLFTVSTALGERVAILDDFVVTASARGGGIGGKLLDEAIAVARQNGCKRISLMTDRINEAAQRLYARHGFAVSSMIPFRRSLD